MARDRDDRADYVTLRQVADSIGIDASTARRGLERLGVRLVWIPCRYFAGQEVLAVSRRDLARFLEYRRARGLAVRPGDGPAAPAAFYAIQTARTSSRGGCGWTWAATRPAIRAGTAGRRRRPRRCGGGRAGRRGSGRRSPRSPASASRALSGEVFEFDDVAAMLARAEAFFALMPEQRRD